jgi:hypothetical protein
MNANRCDRDDELLDALSRAFVPAELDAHARACAACGELRLVAGALLDDRAGAMLQAPLPSAGTVWWRMQLRQRQEAQAVARRSLFIGQALTLVVAIALVVSLLGGNVDDGVRQAIDAIRFNTPMLLVLGMSLLIAPIGGYFVVRTK